MDQDDFALSATFPAPPRHDLILGLTPFTFVHVVITLVAILSGLIVLSGLLRNRRMERTTAVFLVFTVLTAATGFIIQIAPLTPAVFLGFVLSGLIVLALAARYLFHMTGAWRWIYVVTAVTSLYLNCFVLVVQSFQKLPFLREPSYGAVGNGHAAEVFTQVLLLAGFIAAGIFAVRRFRPA